MWICAECGDEFGKYREDIIASTWHIGHCNWCGGNKPVTEDRDFSYPKPNVAVRRITEDDN